jgi:hypothetical protein
VTANSPEVRILSKRLPDFIQWYPYILVLK